MQCYFFFLFFIIFFFFFFYERDNCRAEITVLILNSGHIRYDFRADAKANWYSVNIALNKRV